MGRLSAVLGYSLQRSKLQRRPAHTLTWSWCRDEGGCHSGCQTPQTSSLLKCAQKWKDETYNKDLLTRNMVMVPWSPPRLNASDGTVAGGKIESVVHRRRQLRRLAA